VWNKYHLKLTMTDNEKVAFDLVIKIIKFDTAEELRQVCAEYEEKNESIPERRKEVMIQAIEKAKKRAGIFYARIDELFTSESVDEDMKSLKSFYESCCRCPSTKPRKRKLNVSNEETSEPSPSMIMISFTGKAGADTDTHDIYKITLDAAEEHSEDASTQTRTSTSKYPNFNKRVWPITVFGGEGASCDEIAHLVPLSRKNAESCWFVAEFLFGCSDADAGVNVDEKQQQWAKIQRLLHGSKKRNGNGDKKKVEDTGIKHMVTNKVLISSQQLYFDSMPSVIIVPILSRSDAIDWKGGGYNAIALIDAYHDPASHDSILEDSKSPIETVCEITRFKHGSNEQATEDEVKKAHTLLCKYTRAIAYAQKYRKPTQCEFELSAGGKMFFPTLPDNVESLKVRKISFSNGNANDGSEGHPAPDPLLLVSKAVINLQKRNGFEIAVSEDPEDEHYRPSEESIQAQEEYLREREENMKCKYRNPIGIDVTIVNVSKTEDTTI